MVCRAKEFIYLPRNASAWHFPPTNIFIAFFFVSFVCLQNIAVIIYIKICDGRYRFCRYYTIEARRLILMTILLTIINVARENHRTPTRFPKRSYTTRGWRFNNDVVHYYYTRFRAMMFKIFDFHSKIFA